MEERNTEKKNEIFYSSIRNVKKRDTIDISCKRAVLFFYCSSMFFFGFRKQKNKRKSVFEIKLITDILMRLCYLISINRLNDLVH